MAIFHLHIQSIGRSADRSAVSASAYRSASKMIEIDEAGEVTKKYNFQNKKGVVFSKIFAPDNSSIWMRDRESLWNIIQNKFDTRINSVFAQEIDVALPIELNLIENENLLSEFVEDILVREGMIVDANIHMDNPNNPHAHLMLSTREIIKDGKGEFTFGNKVRFWDRREFLLCLRKSWADYVNKHLSFKGLDIRISHLSNKERQINLSPTIKEGAGRIIENSERSKINQEIMKGNKAKIRENPEIIIDIISSKKSLFTRQDIEYEVSRYFQEEKLHIMKLVLELDRLDLAEFRDLEGRLLYKDKLRSNLEKSFLNMIEEFHSENHNLKIDESEIEKDNFFEDIAKKVGIAKNYTKLSDVQWEAVIKIINSGDICLLEGLPGSGKTITMREVARIYKRNGGKIVASAVSSAASNILGDAIGAKAINTTKLRYEMEKSKGDFKLNLSMDYENKNRGIIDSKTILIIDEASMVDLAEMHYFVSIVRERGAKLILIGDRNQLAAIRLKGAYEHMTSYFPPIRLETVRRHELGIHREATRLLGNFNLLRALEIYNSQENIIFRDEKELLLQNIANDFAKYYIANSNSKIQALAYRKQDVAKLNSLIREELKLAGKIIGNGKFTIGDKIIFTKNDKKLGIFRNDRGEVIDSFGGCIKVRLERNISFGLLKIPIDISLSNLYENIDYSYAITIHKAQGSTYDHSFALLDSNISFNAFTVIVTRHRKDFKLYIPNEIFDRENQSQNKIEQLAELVSKREITSFELDYNQELGKDLIEEYLESKYLVQKLASKRDKHNIFGAISNRKKLALKICDNYQKYRNLLELSQISYDLIQKHAGLNTSRTQSIHVSDLYYRDLSDLYKSISDYQAIPKAPLFDDERKASCASIFHHLDNIKNKLSAQESGIYESELALKELLEKSKESEHKIQKYNQYMKITMPSFLKSIYIEDPKEMVTNWETLISQGEDFDKALESFQNIGNKRGKAIAGFFALSSDRKYANQNFKLLKDRFKLYEEYKSEFSKIKIVSKEEIYQIRSEIRKQKACRLPNYLESLIWELDAAKLSNNADKLCEALDAYLERYQAKIIVYRQKTYYQKNFSKAEIEKIFIENAEKINSDGKIKITGGQISCGSLTMNLENGLWYRFSTGEGGNIHSFLDLAGNNHYVSSNNIQKTPQKSQKNIKQDWVNYKIIPREAPKFAPKAHIPSILRGKRLEDIYSYRNLDNKLIGHTIRVKDGENKLVLPISYCKKGDNSCWRIKGFTSYDGSKPIYGMEKLIKDKPILIVEGEKTANAAEKLFPNHNVISWLGGSSSADKVNWSILKEKEIYIWPDNDEIGIKTAKIVANKIANFKRSYLNIYVINPTKLTLPKKWDLADKLPDEMQNTNLRDILHYTKNQFISQNEKQFCTENEKRIYLQNKACGMLLEPDEVKSIALLEEKYYRQFDSKSCRDYQNYMVKKGDIENPHEFLNARHEFYKSILTSISLKEGLKPDAPQLLDIAEEKFMERASNFTDHIPYMSEYGAKLAGKQRLYGIILRDIMMLHKMQNNMILEAHKEDLAKNLYNIISQEKNHSLNDDKVRIANRAYLELCNSNFYKNQLLEYSQDREISESKTHIQKQISLER